MSHRFLTSTGGLTIVIAVAFLAPVPAAGVSSTTDGSAEPGRFRGLEKDAKDREDPDHHLGHGESRLHPTTPP